MDTTHEFTWTFHRVGGVDQVVLHTSEELRHLDELDPKLWTALTCPVTGLEFDDRTLALIDQDDDGRIRIPEVKTAVDWICKRLKDPAVIVSPGESMPLSVINDQSDEGRSLLLTAKEVLSELGKTGQEALSQDDVTTAAAQAAGHLLNGDGIVPVSAELDPEMRAFIQDALHVTGGLKDASGQPGIDKNIADLFVKNLRERRDWQDKMSGQSSPLKENSAAAWNLLQELQDKIDDYFLRVQLASFAPDASEALNPDQRICAADARNSLTREMLEKLPLARVEANRPLSLDSGLNPAWKDKLRAFFSLAGSLLDNGQTLTRDTWEGMKSSFSAYADALGKKPLPETTKTTFAPSLTIDLLGKDRIQAILDSDIHDRFLELAEKDISTTAGTADILDLERLVHYYLHLHRLLMNFVSFHDFYTLRRKATFQSGRLYIDSRACTLCLPVADVETHSTLASFSQLYLLYCECKRKDATPPDDEHRTIVAAVTDGSSDLLMPGRNGVYIDDDGNDWDATVVKVISNPISLREAMWDPYRKVGRMISDQIGKLAGSKQKNVLDTVETQISVPTTAAPAIETTSASKFDIGKSVGIFAAIGLALGALGTAIATLASAFFSLQWWQFPLVFLGLFLLVSGPSVVLAWLKLRKRNLGPLLEASGWAINGRVSINYLVGRALTPVADLPENANRSFQDPYARRRRWPVVLVLLFALAGAGLALWFWFHPPKMFSSKQPSANATAVWTGSGLSGQITNATEARQKPEIPVSAEPQENHLDEALKVTGQ